MVTRSANRKVARKLSPRRIKVFKAMAKKVDAQEQESIKARGRAIFERHSSVRRIVEKLKRHRVTKGLSLADMALHTGIAKPNLSRLENNEHSFPTLDTLQRYAQALGMDVSVELVGKN